MSGDRAAVSILNMLGADELASVVRHIHPTNLFQYKSVCTAFARSAAGRTQARVCCMCESIELLQWARRAGCPWNEKTCAGVALLGHLEVLQWVRQQNLPWDRDTCAAAAVGGHLEVLQWARQQKCPSLGKKV